MEKVRRTVTLDADVEREWRELSDESLSSLVNDVLRAQIKNIRLQELLDDLNRERGPGEPPPSEDQVRAFRREMAELWLS